MKRYDDPRDLLALAAAGLLEPDELGPAEAAALEDPAQALALREAFRDLAREATPALPAQGWAALAAGLDAQERAGVAPTSPADADLGALISVACIYCHDGLTRHEARYCASCLAPHHAECFEAHGHCAAPGCVEVLTVQPSSGAPAQVVAPRLLPEPPRRRRRLLLAASAASALLAGTAALTLDYRRSPDPLAPQPVASAPQAPSPSPAASEAPRAADPEASAALAMGEAHLLAGDLVAARAAFELAIDLEPESWRGYEGHARVALVSEDHQLALRDLEMAAAFAQDPRGQVDLVLRAVQLWIRLCDYEQARARLDSLRGQRAGLTSALDQEIERARSALLLLEADPFEALASEVGRARLSAARTLPPQEALELDLTLPGALARWRAELGLAWRRRDAQRVLELARRPLTDPKAKALALAAGLLYVEEASVRADIELALRGSFAPGTYDHEPALRAAVLGLARWRAEPSASALADLRQAAALGRSVETPSGRDFRRAVAAAEEARRSRDEPDLRRAARALVQVWQRNPLHAESLVARSRLYASFERHEAALAAATAAAELDPSSAEAQAWLGSLYLEELPLAARDPRRAALAFERALDLLGSPIDDLRAEADALTLRAHARRGRALARLALLDARLEEPLRGWVSLRDGRVFADVLYRDLGEALELRLPLGAIRVSKAEVARIEELPGAPVPEERATALARLEAALLYAAGILPDRYPRATPLQVRRVLGYQEELAAVYEQLGDAEQALRARARANATRAAAAEAAAALVAQARSEPLERRAAALQALDVALELSPEAPGARIARGQLYLKVGNFLAGIRDYAAEVERDGSAMEALWSKVYQISYVVDLNRVMVELNRTVAESDLTQDHFLRGFFCLAKLQFKEAKLEDLQLGLQDLSRCIAVNPRAGSYYFLRALLYDAGLALGTDQEEEALRDLARATELCPDLPSAWLWTARIELRRGREDSSDAAFTQARILLSDERLAEHLAQPAFAQLRERVQARERAAAPR